MAKRWALPCDYISLQSDHADTPPVDASLSEQSEDREMARERERERESSSDTQSHTSPHGSEDGDSNRSKPSGKRWEPWS